MAKYTPNLNLYEKDPVADASDTFNIKTMMNDNWDKIDAAAGVTNNNLNTLDTKITEHIEGASKLIKPYQYTDYGIAFRSDDISLSVHDNHASWTHANVFYDERIDKVVVFYNVKPFHTLDNSRVLMRMKDPEGGFSTPIVVADKTANGVSCKSQSSGIAKNGDYISLVYEFQGDIGTHLYRSTDNGQTWTESKILIDGNPVTAFNGDVSGFLVLKSGRILVLVKQSSDKSTLIYSDDNGVTWSYISQDFAGETEPAWCELSDGTIIAYLRKNVDSIYDVKIPAKFTKSIDGGLTWTIPVDSTSILDFTNSNGHLIYHEESKTVEFIHHSRFQLADGYSSIYVSIASEENAKNDAMGEQIRISRLAPQTKPVNGSTGDSGYIGAAKDKNGVIHAFYYNGTYEKAQICYLKGYKTHVNRESFNLNPNTGEMLESSFILYDNGNEKEFDTGLYTNILNTFGGTGTKNTNNLQLSYAATTSPATSMYISNKVVTVSGYSKIKCKVIVSGISGSAGASLRLFTKNNPSFGSDGRVGITEIKSNGSNILELDIPSGYTSLYPAIAISKFDDGISSSITAKFYEIWLE